MGTKQFHLVCTFIIWCLFLFMCACCFNTVCVLFQCVVCFSTLLCQNSMWRVLSPTFKQHGPSVETTSRQDNTHYVPQATHWCAESTSCHVHWCVILPLLCKNNTWDEIQMLFQHMLQQTTHDGDTHVGYFNMAVFAVHVKINNCRNRLTICGL